MDSKLEKSLYRILVGYLPYKVDGLSLFIHEPSREILLESIDKYDEAYERAFIAGCYVKSEIQDYLLSLNLWSPLDDRKADEIEKEVENLKVEAFQNFFDAPKLRSIKHKIRAREKEYSSLRGKKMALDQFTCEGTATYCKWLWIMSRVVKNRAGKVVKVNTTNAMNYYNQNDIPSDMIREIARSEPFKSMWVAHKRTNIPIFSSLLTQDQVTLSVYAGMYDNVRENPECPDDKIINDDDCLDGWFIDARRKQDRDRKKDDILSNERIKNSKEVFIMAGDKETAQNIYDMNDMFARSKLNERLQVMEEKGKVKDFDFRDVRQDIEMQKTQMTLEKMRGK